MLNKTAQSEQITHCKYCLLLLSAAPISRHQKFCSRKCKGDSQKREISLFCPNCGKEFSIDPYLKRTTNYCSRKCYWNASRRKHKRVCKICGKEFQIKEYLIKKSFGKFCSKKCQFLAYQNKQVGKKCKRCGEEFLVAPSISKKKKFCSKWCKDEHERDYVFKICRNCRNKFLIPRWEVNKGKGSFCSRECFKKFKGKTSIEKIMRRALKRTGIDFEQEVRVGIYYVDFLLKGVKTVIECDGDYWHSIPSAAMKDSRKDKFLNQNGYRVYRFRESEIKSSAEECIQKMALKTK